MQAFLSSQGNRVKNSVTTPQSLSRRCSSDSRWAAMDRQAAGFARRVMPGAAFAGLNSDPVQLAKYTRLKRRDRVAIRAGALPEVERAAIAAAGVPAGYSPLDAGRPSGKTAIPRKRPVGR